ncbi:oligopeptide binding lipoprotein [Streptococcus pneumoniae]|nr:oligopeptide binding lipoprotein [Streptococcus pneumoniae]
MIFWKKQLTKQTKSCIIKQIFKAGGSGNSSTASKTYNYVYSSDPSSLNYLAENRAATSDIVANLVDGLLENDQYGNIIPSLAEDWTVSQDGLTYTYKLRKDAK